MNDDEIVALAATWMAAGFPTFVIELRELPTKIEKLPTSINGHLDGTTDVAAFAVMLADARQRRSGAVLGIGVCPGPAGVVVLDYDTKNQARGGEVLAAHQAEFGDVIGAVSYHSISGATNVMLRKADLAMIVGNTSPRSWVDVDVRSDRGWVVPPGVTTPWGSWDWLSGDLDGIADAVMPEGLAAQLILAGTETYSEADIGQIREWFDAGGTTTDAFYLRAIEGWCRSIATCGNRNPTLFEALTWLRRMPAADISRKDAVAAISDAWRERMAADGETGRDDEPFDVLARIVGFERGTRARESHVTDDEQMLADIEARARALWIDEEARALNHSRRIAALGEFEKPLIGLDAIRERLAAAGERCFWGTGDTILLARGETLMLAGREGTGKTTIALQVVRAALGGDWKVLGHRVDELAPDEFVLYLAIDRPRQIQEAMLQVLANEPGTDRLILWTYGVVRHVQAGREKFLEWLASIVGPDRKLGLVVVDSLKDVIVRLSSDEDAGRWQQIRTAFASLDVPVIELHHFKKDGSGTGNDALFGSALLAAGAGSIIQIHGDAGDDTFLLQQTKMPAEGQEPLKIQHVRDAGSGWVTNVIGTQRTDYETAMVGAGEAGFTIPELVGTVEDTRKEDTRKHAIQREVKRLLASGRVVETDQKRGTPTRPARVYRWAAFDVFGDIAREEGVLSDSGVSSRDDADNKGLGTPPRTDTTVLEDQTRSNPVPVRARDTPEPPSDEGTMSPVGMTLDEAVDKFGKEAVEALWESGYQINDEGVIDRAD